MTHYKEEQRINRSIIVLFMIFSISFIAYSYLQGVASSSSLVIEVLALFFINIFLLSIKLTLKVSDRSLKYQLFPFHFKEQTIAFDNIESISGEKLNLLYWGLGLRFDLLRNIKGYIVSGSHGLKVILKTKKKIMLSSKDITHLMNSIQISK
jgi:hypothetical protein